MFTTCTLNFGQVNLYCTKTVSTLTIPDLLKKAGDWEVFMDANDLDEEGTFVHSDGSPVGHLEYAFFEPNNLWGVEHYISCKGSNGQCNDVDNSDKYSMCQKGTVFGRL